MCRTGFDVFGVSECRNKSLQMMFQLMGGGDKAGSGMDKIRAGWRVAEDPIRLTPGQYLRAALEAAVFAQNCRAAFAEAATGYGELVIRARGEI
jgi:hypothetical protein